MSTAVKQRAKVTQLIIYFLKLVLESLKRHLNSHWEIGKFCKLYLNIHNFIHIALCPQLYAAFNIQNRNLYFSPYHFVAFLQKSMEMEILFAPELKYLNIAFNG